MSLREITLEELTKILPQELLEELAKKALDKMNRVYDLSTFVPYKGDLPKEGIWFVFDQKGYLGSYADIPRAPYIDHNYKYSAYYIPTGKYSRYIHYDSAKHLVHASLQPISTNSAKIDVIGYNVFGKKIPPELVTCYAPPSL
jgi:hypothetical protein